MTDRDLAEHSLDELRRLKTLLEEKIHEGEERERIDAIGQIKETAARVGFEVATGEGRLIIFTNPRRRKDGRVQLRQGDIYVNPADPRQRYVIGNGRPPEWFNDLWRTDTLPLPLPRRAAS